VLLEYVLFNLVLHSNFIDSPYNYVGRPKERNKEIVILCWCINTKNLITLDTAVLIDSLFCRKLNNISVIQSLGSLELTLAEDSSCKQTTVDRNSSFRNLVKISFNFRKLVGFNFVGCTA